MWNLKFTWQKLFVSKFSIEKSISWNIILLILEANEKINPKPKATLNFTIVNVYLLYLHLSSVAQQIQFRLLFER